jgi:hypothetical protein
MTLPSLLASVRARLHLDALQVSLVSDWREALRWSETRITIVMTAFYAALLSAAQMLPVLAAHWPDLAPAVLPFLVKYFPTASQAAGPLIAVVLNMAARMVEIKLPRKVVSNG